MPDEELAFQRRDGCFISRRSGGANFSSAEPGVFGWSLKVSPEAGLAFCLNAPRPIDLDLREQAAARSN